jgi:hypothetical protein
MRHGKASFPARTRRVWPRAFALLAILLIVLSSCAPGANTLQSSANANGVVAGFWRGLWNGVISPVTFVISLFNRDVQMYEVHNNGGWYNLGFLLGVSVIFGGGAGSARARRRRD